MMDLKKILENLKQDNAGTSKFGMNNLEEFSRNLDLTIKKEAFEIDSSAVYLFPLQLKFPFNPFNPVDKNYNRNNKYISPYSCSSTAFAIKAEMRKSPALKEFYCKLAEVDPKEYNLNTLDSDGRDKITEDDWKVFGYYRCLLHYSALVQKFTYSSFGKYGKKALSNVKRNEAGIVVGQKDMGYKLYELENGLSAEKVSAIYKDYSEDGSKWGKPDTDRKKEVKKAWQECPASKPYKLGSLRFIKLKSDADYVLDKDLKDKILKDGSKILGFNEVYGSGNKRDTKKFEAYLGRAADIFFDFLELGIWYPPVDDVDKDSEKLESYGRRDVNNNPVTRINQAIPRIEEMYRELRDDTDRFCEDVMLRSVRDYRQLDDDVLLQACKEDLGEKKDYITSEILKTYGALLKKADKTLTEDLMEMSMEGVIADGGEEISLEGMVEPDEDQKGFGIAPTDEEIKELDFDLEDDI